jgi:hypothetical protein
LRKILTILFSVIVSVSYSQDIIITKSDTVEGKITQLTPEKIYLLIKKQNKPVKTHIHRSAILDFHFAVIEELMAEYDSLQTYVLVTPEGNETRGKIEAINKTSVEFRTEYLGVVVVEAYNIQQIYRQDSYVPRSGKSWFPNPNSTRYLFGPSAYNLEKGEGYYQNTYVFLNMVNLGVTDYFSVGGGFEFISTFTGNPIAFITLKLGFPVTEKFSLGGGILAGVLTGEASAGIIYSIATYGSKEHNITAGLGYGYIDRELSSRPVLTFSGMTRAGQRVSFVTENWIVPINGSYYPVISYGMRLFGPKMSFDIAFFNSSDIFEEIFIGIPYVDFVIKF